MNTEYLSDRFHLKPFNSIYREFHRRKISNFHHQSPLSKNIVPDFLLETFECAKDDKFLLYSDDLQESPAYQCRFCPDTNYSHIALLAKEDGGILMFNTERSGPTAVIQNFKAHKNCIFDAHWIGHDHIITSSGDWTVKYHDLNTEQAVSKFTGHSGSVKALSIRPNHTNMFASSSRDGSIMLWDINSRTRCLRTDASALDDIPSIGAVSSFYNAHHLTASVSTTVQKVNKRKSSLASSTNIPRPVTSIVFANENLLVSSGTCDGKLKFWDIRKISKTSPQTVKTITYSGKMENAPGYTDLLVNRSGRMLFAYCKDGFVYQYDIESASYNIPLFQYTGHVSNSYYLKMDLSPDENYLICGSSSFSPYIYHVGVVPQRPVILNGHKAEVTACRWCPSDPGLIMSISDDCTAMVHRMRPGSEYNVFYRDQIKREPKPLGHSLAPLSLSSRIGEETVTQQNQYYRIKNTKEHVDIKAKFINNLTIEQPQFPMLSTPNKMKDQSIKSFLSPITNSNLVSQESQPKSSSKTSFHIFGEKTNNLSQSKLTDRSKSVLVKINKFTGSPQAGGRKRSQKAVLENEENHSQNTNNVKRRKTVVTQPSIAHFFKSEDDSYSQNQ